MTSWLACWLSGFIGLATYPGFALLGQSCNQVHNNHNEDQLAISPDRPLRRHRLILSLEYRSDTQVASSLSLSLPPLLTLHLSRG